jgi:hypothetical protein
MARLRVCAQGIQVRDNKAGSKAGARLVGVDGRIGDLRGELLFSRIDTHKYVPMVITIHNSWGNALLRDSFVYLIGKPVSR